MKKVDSKRVNIKLLKKDVEIIKEVLELEKANIEVHRIAKNGKESEYEKRLKKIIEEFTNVVGKN